MDQREIIAWRERTQDSLARIRDRQRGASLLLASSLTGAARELLAAAFAEIDAVGKDMVSAGGMEAGPAAQLAQERLVRLRSLAGRIEEGAVGEWDELLDMGDFTLEALENLFGELKRGPMRTASDRRKRVAFVLSAFFTAAALASGLFLGPPVYEKWQDGVRQKKIRAAQGALTELASLALDAKKASEKTLVQITGETCSDCACKDSVNLQALYEFDGCSLRWRKAITAIHKAATGREDMPERFLRDPWGAPFALNENEGEVKGECTPDIIRSAGPDGILNTSDDIGIAVPTAFCQQANQ